MDTKKELKILFWMIVVFVAVFFMPLGSERFMTAVDATFDLAKWYAQEHVVLCLLPAFFIAGVIAVFVSQGSVLKYFGANAKKWLSYTVAAVSGGILAVCSCTILPLFTSIYKRGAGLGPAIAFLYSGPAISILSIILTARILGIEMGIARTILRSDRSCYGIYFPKGRESQTRGADEYRSATGKTPDVADVVSLFYVGADSRLCKLGCALCL